MKKILSAFVLGMVYSVNASAGCDSFLCLVDNMPHYDQNGAEVFSSWHLDSTSKTTNLCVPTSITMMTQTMLNNHFDSIKTNKNVDIVHFFPSMFMSTSTFRNATAASKVNFMARTLDTTKDGGTGGWSPEQFFKNAPTFFSNYFYFLPGGRSRFNADLGVSVHTLKQNSVNDGITTAAYVNFGHYNRKKSMSFFGMNFYNIERDGGHAVAQRGYLGDLVYIYDPWFRNKFFTTIQNVYSGFSGNNYYFLPNGYTRVSVLQANYTPNDYWPIIERNGSFGKRKY